MDRCFQQVVQNDNDTAVPALEQSEFVRSAKGFDGRASPDDNARFAVVAFRDVEAHRGLEASRD